MCLGDKKHLLIVVFVACCASSIEAGAYGRSNRSGICDKFKFECQSGQCIPEEKLCDGFEDCVDGSDETKDCVNIIPCSSHFLFQCDYGACINKSFQCDGKKDCKDGSDESTFACEKCGRNKFKCGSGECIDKSFLCDGIGDCNDYSDETQDECLSTVCPRYGFRCDYGACIMKRFKCNGVNDCVDGSDEEFCNKNTAPSSASNGYRKFRCGSGEFIEDTFVCDGVGDCQDESDETERLCGDFNCPLYTYRCKYGACVNRNARCNGVVDCVDSSDENGCNFTPSAAKAPAPEPTKPKCQLDEFKCTSGKCIQESLVCDGKKDCDDASEETFQICAYIRCSQLSFTCGYGACVPKKARCDGVIDCLDASDEQNCTVSTTEKPEPTSGCLVPPHPDFGNYKIATNPLLTQGSIAPSYSVLIPNCNRRYGITPPEENFSVCLGTQWTPNPQNCTRTCPRIEATAPIECKFNNRPLKTCDKAVQGTIALVQCDSGSDGVVKSIVNFCRDGLWNAPVNQCIATSSTNTSTNQVNIFYIFNNQKK